MEYDENSTLFIEHKLLECLDSSVVFISKLFPRCFDVWTGQQTLDNSDE